MTARDVCLSPAEWENALVQLQLAKQLGLIDDASPEALEARRQAKNAENARLQAAGTVFYEMLSPRLTEDEKVWLKNKCAPIGR